jgi:hypothetical protein
MDSRFRGNDGREGVRAFVLDPLFGS